MWPEVAILVLVSLLLAEAVDVAVHIPSDNQDLDQRVSFGYEVVDLQPPLVIQGRGEAHKLLCLERTIREA
eukprot:1727889-Heterocapsa_arctica.AAC.1